MVQMLVRSQVVEKTKSRQGLPRSWGWLAPAAPAGTGCGRGSGETAHDASDSQGTGGTRSAAQRASAQ